MLRNIRLPLAPRVDLKVGSTWKESASLAPLVAQPLELVATVAGRTKATGRDCLQIKRVPAGHLPLTIETEAITVILNEYTETLCIDRSNAQVATGRWELRGTAAYSGAKQTAALDITLALREIRKLSPAQVASRAKQAAGLARLQDAAMPAGPGADALAAMEKLTEGVTQFRRQYPQSPYRPVLDQIDGYIGRMRASLQNEQRHQGDQRQAGAGVPARVPGR